MKANEESEEQAASEENQAGSDSTENNEKQNDNDDVKIEAPPEIPTTTMDPVTQPPPTGSKIW